MMNSLDVLALVIGIGSLVCLYTLLPQRGQKGILAATLLSALFLTMTSPVLAAAVDDNTLSEGQKELQENLKTTPNNNQYQGIEYAQEKGTALSDREITRRVKQEVPDNLKVSVSNGSVRLSGKVASRDAAQRIVQDIKEVSGVHEVSYDLGFDGQ